MQVANAPLKDLLASQIQYSRWATEELYASIERGLQEFDVDLKHDVGLFFGSIYGTLVHLYVSDIVWYLRLVESDTYVSEGSGL